MKRRSGIFIGCITLLALLFAAGCSGDEEKESLPTEQSGKAEAKKEAAFDETDKWNAYVDLSNRMNEKFFGGYEKYIETFGSGEDFKKPEGSVTNYSNSVINGHDLVKALDRAYEVSADQPRDSLDQSVQTLAPPLKSMWNNMVALKDYIKNKEYIDDNYAKAGELHKQIMAAAPEVEAAVEPFMTALTSQETVMREKSMKKMLAEGLKIRAGMLEVLNEAEKILNYFNQKNISHTNIQSLDVEDFRPLYVSFGEAVKKLEATATDEQINAEKIYAGGVKNYIEVAKETRTQAAAMIEYVQENKVPARVGPNTPGTPESYANKFKLLVSRYNSYIN